MSDYQGFSRKYRPQCFADLLGQEPIVKTLRQAILKKRLGHAYLFAGPHGTGKTSLARLFAKALNCTNLTSDGEPCNQCPSCKEIAGSYSLDVLEIDGASNRGIEDIRKINETLAYTAPTGKYKIYLIDEVHMLTKEAFNALLKSLEEPPAHVKFFFATTEPHLIPATILSRCQRFHLKRIEPRCVREKLKKIADENGTELDGEVYDLLIRLSEGGMRDAESCFDQLLAFGEKNISLSSAEELFGILDKKILNTCVDALLKGSIVPLFEAVEKLFNEGKHLQLFLEDLLFCFRKRALAPTSSEKDLKALVIIAEGLQEIRSAISKRFFIECLLMRVVDLYRMPSLGDLVTRLEALEKKEPIEKPIEKEMPEQIESKHAEPSIKTSVSDERVDTLMQFAAKELRGNLKKG